MPRRAYRLLPGAYALLGLLAERPTHGYDLHRPFAPGGVMADVCRLEINQLYALLKQLVAGGLAEERGQEAVGATPPRRILALTDAGRAALAEWLQEPVSHTREIRLEFLLKLYFAGLHNPDLLPGLLAAQRSVTRRLVARLAAQAAMLADQPSGDFRRAVVDLRLRQNRAVLAWLEDIQPPQPDYGALGPSKQQE